MLRDNFAQILRTIEQTAIGCGRSPHEIRLLAVSKTIPPERIQEAIDCGQATFGENYLQEAAGKISILPPTVSWHFIGHLQSNKVRQTVELFDVIETVDRWKIAQAINGQAIALKKDISVFIQVNIGDESQKSGVAPHETEGLLQRIVKETQLKVLGLMTIPPWFPDPEKSRPYFRELRVLAQQMATLNLFADSANVELSMGMSNDFPVAIEEGATLVRVGTALFGPRSL